ncbi:11719_t:CDS:1, partial [Entrophospora sp. SA101]
NLARAVQAITDNVTSDEYQNSFQEWQRRLKLCIDVDGEYFEGMQ